MDKSNFYKNKGSLLYLPFDFDLSDNSDYNQTVLNNGNNVVLTNQKAVFNGTNTCYLRTSFNIGIIDRPKFAIKFTMGATVPTPQFIVGGGALGVEYSGVFIRSSGTIALGMNSTRDFNVIAQANATYKVIFDGVANYRNAYLFDENNNLLSAVYGVVQADYEGFIYIGNRQELNAPFLGTIDYIIYNRSNVGFRNVPFFNDNLLKAKA